MTSDKWCEAGDPLGWSTIRFVGVAAMSAVSHMPLYTPVTSVEQLK